MGFDDILGKVDDLVDQHADKITDGIDKAADFIDEKTGGKFADKIDMVQTKADEMVDKMSKDDK